MAKGKGGRPTTYTREQAEKLCAWVSEGCSLTDACQLEGVSIHTVMGWLRKHTEFQQEYARARERRGEYYGNRVMEVAKRCENGDLDYNRARVAMDGYKWAAARMAPKAWGDKQQHEHTGEAGGAIQFVIREASPDPEQTPDSTEG